MKTTMSQGETVSHTPGPWQFDGMWSLIMAGKYEIAAVHAARTMEEKSKRKRLDEVNANARLIAAAPDLLSACKVALEVFYTVAWRSDDPEQANVIAQLQSAIDCATSQKEGAK